MSHAKQDAARALEASQAQQAHTKHRTMGITTHHPAPPTVPDEPEFSWQRRFGMPGMWDVNTVECMAGGCIFAAATVFRDARTDVAQLQVQVGIETNVQLALRLRADELRRLAHALLDAAHDIDTHPAHALHGDDHA